MLREFHAFEGRLCGKPDQWGERSGRTGGVPDTGHLAETFGRCQKGFALLT